MRVGGNSVTCQAIYLNADNRTAAHIRWSTRAAGRDAHQVQARPDLAVTLSHAGPPGQDLMDLIEGLGVDPGRLRPTFVGRDGRSCRARRASTVERAISTTRQVRARPYGRPREGEWVWLMASSSSGRRAVDPRATGARSNSLSIAFSPTLLADGQNRRGLAEACQRVIYWFAGDFHGGAYRRLCMAHFALEAGLPERFSKIEPLLRGALMDVLRQRPTSQAPFDGLFPTPATPTTGRAHPRFIPRTSVYRVCMGRFVRLPREPYAAWSSRARQRVSTMPTAVRCPPTSSRLVRAA